MSQQRRRTVLIFKSESESTDHYAERLQHFFFNPIFVPTLSFGFKNLSKLRQALLQPEHYAGIVFTSPRCVEAVVQALQHNDLPSDWKMLHNFSVGEVTHNLAMSSLQQLFTQGKQTGNARALAEFIVETFDGAKHKPLLLPCSNLAQDTLLAHLVENGFKVEAHEVYETKCNPELAERMQQALQEKDIEFLAFFSPSGVNCACEYFTAHNISTEQWKLVAIGPSTRRALTERGLPVFCTAKRPTVDSLIQVLINPDDCREHIKLAESAAESTKVQ